MFLNKTRALTGKQRKWVGSQHAHHNHRLCFTPALVMVSIMCQLDWPTACPDMGSDIILVSL